MAAINKGRFWLGVLAGGVVWTALGYSLGQIGGVQAEYAAATGAGYFLKVPRYSWFMAEWIILLFLLTYIMAWLYVSLRPTLGAGPWTARSFRISQGAPISLQIRNRSPDLTGCRHQVQGLQNQINSFVIRGEPDRPQDLFAVFYIDVSCHRNA